MPSYEYKEGYADGFVAGRQSMQRDIDWIPENQRRKPTTRKRSPVKKAVRRKKSKWQIYMGQKKNQIKLRNGKLNLKKMGIAYRKKNKKK